MVFLSTIITITNKQTTFHMKKTTISLMVAAACAATLSPAFGQTTINSASDITGNSTLSNGTYWLNPGSYVARDNATMTQGTSSLLPSALALNGFTFNGSMGIKAGELDISSDYHVDYVSVGTSTYDRQYGLYLHGSQPAFFQEGGAVTLTGKGIAGDNAGSSTGYTNSYGLFIDGENAQYVQSGGVMNALGVGGSDNEDTGRADGYGYGLYLLGKNASYLQYGGTVNAKASVILDGLVGAHANGTGFGIYLDGAGAAYEQYGGVLNVNAQAEARDTANGLGPDGRSEAFGVYVSGVGARFVQHDGIVNANAVAIAARTDRASSAYGIYLRGNEASYIQENGVFNASGIARGASNSGTSNAKGVAAGLNITGADVSFYQFGGVVNANGTATGSTSGSNTSEGYGIRMDGANAQYIQNGGTVYATGYGASLSNTGSYGNGWGIAILGDGSASQSGYVQNGGFVDATGNAANSNGTGAGIFLSGGNGDTAYQLNGGTLRMMPGSVTNNGTVYSVYIKASGLGKTASASFANGAMLRPGVDFVAKRSGVMRLEGQSSATTSVSIDPGAVLEPWLISSIKLDKGQWLMPIGDGVTFLESTQPITDTFTQPLPTITMDYRAFKANDAGEHQYKLNIYRRNWVSEVTEGPVKDIAESLENNRDWVLSDAGSDYNDFYSNLDMMRDNRSAEEYARKFSPWGTTRVYRLMLMNFDKVQSALFSGIHSTSPSSVLAQNETIMLASADPGYSLGRDRGKHNNAWLVPVFSYDTFNGKNGHYAKTDGYTAGFSFGASQATPWGTFGLTGSYLRNKQQGDGYTLENDSFYVMGGYQSPEITAFDSFHPRVEAALGYGYAYADQERIDANGTRHQSSPDQQGVRAYLGMTQTVEGAGYRVTPRFGLDYTYIKLDGVTESGRMGLKTSGDDVNSLRPKLGGDIAWGVTDRFAVTGQAYARYELLDTHVVLATGFAGTPINWRVRGEESERLSALAGIGFAYVPKKDMRINGRYQLEMGDGYNSHQVELSLNWQF